MIKVLYSLYPTDDLIDNKIDYIHLQNDVNNRLNDKRGWKTYDYEFIPIDCDNCEKQRKIAKYKYDKPIELRFLTNENMIKTYGNSINNLSCYVPYEHSVCINIDNWNKGGVDPFKPKGGESPIDRYRNYVLNHEFGHALGLNHPKATAGFAPVMEQMTKGIKNLNRAEPNKEKWVDLNEFPLPKKVFDEEYGKHHNLYYKKVVKGGELYNSAYMFILLFFICFVVIVLIILKIIKPYISMICGLSTYN